MVYFMIHTCLCEIICLDNSLKTVEKFKYCNELISHMILKNVAFAKNDNSELHICHQSEDYYLNNGMDFNINNQFRK